MRIDAHQHFWIYDPQRDQWITEEMKKIRRDFLPGDLVPLLRENSFDGCIAVQVESTEANTEFLLNLARHDHFIRGVVGWVDLGADDVRSRLEYFSQFKVLKGFRHMVQSEPNPEFLLSEDFGRGVGLLKEHNFTYDLLVYPSQLPSVVAFAEKFPDQPMVIDHLAKPKIKAREIDVWSGYIERIAANKNVYCKLSGLVTEADWKTWDYRDLAPYLEVVVDAFGTDRLMYGSDWPVCLVAATYREQLTVTQKYFRTFLVREQEAVFGGNAVRFYNLS